MLYHVFNPFLGLAPIDDFTDVLAADKKLPKESKADLNLQVEAMFAVNIACFHALRRRLSALGSLERPDVADLHKTYEGKVENNLTLSQMSEVLAEVGRQTSYKKPCSQALLVMSGLRGPSAIYDMEFVSGVEELSRMDLKTGADYDYAGKLLKLAEPGSEMKETVGFMRHSLREQADMWLLQEVFDVDRPAPARNSNYPRPAA